MILTGNKIKDEVTNGHIIIRPFSSSNINPNSYNFHLSNKLLVYNDDVLDVKKDLSLKEIIIPEDGYVLEKDKLYLSSTIEIMGSEKYIPMIFGRSSIGRLGLFIQITAPIGDIGYEGNWTLQLNATVPIKVYPGLKIGQIMFFSPYGEITPYDGKYKNSRTPRKSEIYKDFQ